MSKVTRINPTAEVEYVNGSFASGWMVYNVRTPVRLKAGLYDTREEAERAAEALHIACESLAAQEG